MDSRKKLTVGSLFSGAGCGDLGLEWAGFEHKWFCEIDDYARKVLELRFPGKPIYGDIRNIQSKEYLDTLVREFYPPEKEEYSKEELEMSGKLKKLTVDQVEECIKMYNQGLSTGKIAEYYNVSRQAMWELLKKRTTMRSQKRYGKDNNFYRGGVSSDDKAQNILEYAIRKGSVKRVNVCERCGSSGAFKDGRNKVQAHHCDYNKPLEVMWLCQKCHHEWHKNNTAVERRCNEEAPQVDVLVGGFPR